MHRGVGYLFYLISTNIMHNTWPYINRKYLSLVVVIIIHAVHTVSAIFLHWYVLAIKILIYYQH